MKKNEDRVRVGDCGIDQNQVTPTEMSGNRDSNEGHLKWERDGVSIRNDESTS